MNSETMKLNEVAAFIGGHSFKIVNISGKALPGSDWAIFRTEKVKRGKRFQTVIVGEKLVVSSVVRTPGVMNGQAIEFSEVVFNRAEIEALLNS